MMDYNDYLSGLKRVTFSDIKDIIKEELNNISDYKAFGFRKEDYGNTIIIEQVDGIDTYYSNINYSNIKLYDYVEKGEALGEAINDNLYLKFEKDGKSLDYKKYL